MGDASCDGRFEVFCDRLRQEIAPFVGQIEYGNLRSRISVWEGVDGGRVTNVALVYETPGGSTDQINVSFDHGAGLFSIIDEREQVTEDVDEVLEYVHPRVAHIPGKRRESLEAEIRRQFDSGIGRAGLFGHITRLLQSDFKGGAITHQELQQAMRFAIQYSRGDGTRPPAGFLNAPIRDSAPPGNGSPARTPQSSPTPEPASTRDQTGAVPLHAKTNSSASPG
jgi:hypothetical protein